MNRLLIITILTILFILKTYCQSGISESERLFDIWIESKLINDKWPGAIVGIVKDQKLVWTKSYGYANLDTKEKIQPETMFAIASNTKMFTAIAIMKLRNQGLLNLDDPVYQYVPEFTKLQSYENAQPDKVTIRHILTHTSGLPVEPWYFNWKERPYLNEIVKNLEKQTLSLPVSVDFKYSNLGYSILGKVIENVTGQTYEEYMKDEVLGIIGMTNSGFDIEVRRKYAQGYQRLRGKNKREEVQLLDYNGWSPAGGLYTNLEDLTKYVSWLIRTNDGKDTTLLNSETLREMHRVSWVPKSWSYGIGLGFFIYKHPKKMIGHGGHNPGFKTDITIFPESQIGIITLTNGEDIPELPDDSESIAAHVIKYIVPKFIDPPAKEKVTSTYNRHLYEGVFSGYWGEYKVVEVDGVLTIFRISDKNPDSYKLEFINNNTFRVSSDYFSRWRGEHVLFKDKVDGEMTKLLMDGTTFYRIKE